MSVLYIVDDIVDELYNFYYCPSCNKVTQNVEHRIMSQYCPNCLFDVPSLSLTQDIGKCTRSCLCCPLCQVTLSVYKNKLVCCYCGYQYLEFEKATGIGSKILKGYNDGAFAKELDKRKQVFKDIYSFQNKPIRYKIAKGPMKDETSFDLVSISPEDDEKMAFLVKQTYNTADNALFNVPNVDQSVDMIMAPIINSAEYPNHFLPSRMNLNTKSNIHCKCGFTLTKVEPKINQIMPTESYCANQFLPRAFIYMFNDKKVLLRISNTQSTAVTLKIKCEKEEKIVKLEALDAENCIPNDAVPNILPIMFSVFATQKYWTWVQCPTETILGLLLEFKYGDEVESRSIEYGIKIHSK